MMIDIRSLPRYNQGREFKNNEESEGIMMIAMKREMVTAYYVMTSVMYF